MGNSKASRLLQTAPQFQCLLQALNSAPMPQEYQASFSKAVGPLDLAAVFHRDKQKITDFMPCRAVSVLEAHGHCRRDRACPANCSWCDTSKQQQRQQQPYKKLAIPSHSPLRAPREILIRHSYVKLSNNILAGRLSQLWCCLKHST